jgi:hypothetical protein
MFSHADINPLVLSSQYLGVFQESDSMRMVQAANGHIDITTDDGSPRYRCHHLRKECFLLNLPIMFSALLSWSSRIFTIYMFAYYLDMKIDKTERPALAGKDKRTSPKRFEYLSDGLYKKIPCLCS